MSTTAEIQATIQKIITDDVVLQLSGACESQIICTGLSIALGNAADTFDASNLARVLQLFPDVFPPDEIRAQFPDAAPVGANGEIEIRATFFKTPADHRFDLKWLVLDTLAECAWRLQEKTGIEPSGFAKLKEAIQTKNAVVEMFNTPDEEAELNQNSMDAA